MSIHKKPRSIYINSANRIDPTITTSDNFTVQIPRGLIPFTPKSAKIRSIMVPHVWSSVTAGSNNFEVNGNPLSVPATNYNGSSLAAALQTEVQTVLPTATVTYDGVTGKYTFADVGVFTLDFNVADSIGPILGFGTSTNAGLNSYTSTGVGNLSIDKYVWITSSLIAGIDAGVIVADGTETSRNILLAMPVLADYGFIPTYEPAGDDCIFNIENSAFSEAIRLGTAPALMDINFAIISPSGGVIDMGGHDWEMVIELSPYIYDFSTD